MFTVVTLLSIVIAPSESTNAIVYSHCDNDGEIYVAYDGLEFTEIGIEHDWPNLLTVTIPNVTMTTIIRFSCQDKGYVGGFIANVRYKNENYPTTKYLNESNWELVSSSDNITSPLVYTIKNEGAWKDMVIGSEMPADAYWAWNNQVYNTMVFEFKFSNVMNIISEYVEWCQAEIFSSGNQWLPVFQNNEITRINIGQSMSFSMEIKINSLPSQNSDAQSIFHCGLTDGQREPGIWIYPQSSGHMGFHISFTENFNWNPSHQIGDPLVAGSIYNLRLIITSTSLEFLINDTTLYENNNYDSHPMVENVPCYAGDPWWYGADVEYRNIRICENNVTMGPTHSPTPTPTNNAVDIVPFSCQSRVGAAVTYPTLSSKVACLSDETLVSCGTKGWHYIGGTWIDPQHTNECIATNNVQSTYSVQAVAYCCTFPHNSIDSVITKTSVNSGEFVSTVCEQDSVLTGCQSEWISGDSGKSGGSLQGSYTGPSQGGNAPQTDAWISTGNQCNSEVYSGAAIVNGGAQCLKFVNGYTLDCKTKAQLETKSGFGDSSACTEGYKLIGCNTWTTSYSLDAYYMTSNDICYVQQDSYAKMYVNGICCQLTHSHENITIPPTMRPTRQPTITGKYELLLQNKPDHYFMDPNLENENDPQADTYSILGTFNYVLQKMYKDVNGRYHFKLIYNYSDGTQDILEWAQSNWVTDEHIYDADLYGIPFQTVSVDGGQYFGGLAKNIYYAQYSLIDGDGIEHNECWNCVGQKIPIGAGIPAFNGHYAKTSSLYIWKPTHVSPSPTSDTFTTTTFTCIEAMRDGLFGTDYRGCQDKTISGRTCQKWTTQSPHEHSRTPQNYPGYGLGNHNYCRNPDGEYTIWCYTTDPNVRWEHCVPLSTTTQPAMDPTNVVTHYVMTKTTENVVIEPTEKKTDGTKSNADDVIVINKLDLFFIVVSVVLALCIIGNIVYCLKCRTRKLIKHIRLNEEGNGGDIAIAEVEFDNEPMEMTLDGYVDNVGKMKKEKQKYVQLDEANVVDGVQTGAVTGATAYSLGNK